MNTCNPSTEKARDTKASGACWAPALPRDPYLKGGHQCLLVSTYAQARMHTPHIHVRNTLIVRHSQGKLTPEIQSQFITRKWISWGRRVGQWAKCLPHKPENLSSCLLPSHIKMGVLAHDCDTSPGEETGGPIELQAPDSLRGHVSKSKLEHDWKRHLASASGAGVHACTHMGMRKRAFAHTQTHRVGTINLLYRQIKGRKGIKLSQKTKASDKI